MKLKALSILFFAPLICAAQFSYTTNQSVVVENSMGELLDFPWVGGLNSPQFNTIDLNADGKDDLVVYDRAGNRLYTFVQSNGKYQYAPEYENIFPEGIRHWVLFRDFNGNGRKDIFTSDPFGLNLFVNTSSAGETPRWRPYNNGLPLFTKGFSGNINLKFNETDIPVIDDVDGDGDLDILNVQFVSNSAVEYHKNLSLEQTGSRDTLIFERITQYWGSFEECDCGVFAFGEPCPGNSTGRMDHAGGKAMLYIDFDQDGLKDLLFAEEACNEIYFLKNEGTNETPLFSTASIFPQPHPNNIQFPAAFYEDVDFDGIPDLIITPNLYFRQNNSIDFGKSVWFYKNKGTDSSPEFNLALNNLLQNQMIDIGEQSIVAFADFDNDGDQDLFFSHYGNPDTFGNIILYENTGAPNNPIFTFKTDDYIPQTTQQYRNMKITFADLNNDGRNDLVFTATAQADGLTSLYYVANTGNGAYNFTNSSISQSGVIINPNENIHLHDINNDGKPDLLIGKSNGAIEYWRNTSIGNNLNFTLESTAFRGIGSSLLRQFPAIFIADLDGDGNKDLLMGDQSGTISIVKDIFNNSSPVEFVKDIVFDEVKEELYAKNFGGRVWPVAVNIFGSKQAAIAIGNALGGINLLEARGGDTQEEPPLISLYPNPVISSELLHIQVNRNATMRIVNMLGQIIGQNYFIPANEEVQVNTIGLSAGIYIAQFSINNKSYTRRFVVIR
jgi:hypothetical protein